MIILGLNAYHGDASAAVVVDGELLAAAEEERFTRIKHNAGFPYQAVRYCLAEAGVRPSEIDYIAVSRNPKAQFAQKIFHTIKRKKWKQFLDRAVSTKKLWNIVDEVAKAVDVDPQKIKAQVEWVEHHRSHLASSFFVSPFEKSALFSVDGFGDFVSTMWGIGQGNQMQISGRVGYPHSLGVFYTALTQYLGFPHYGDEYKVMGLAAYGHPVYQKEFSKIVSIAPTAQSARSLAKPPASGGFASLTRSKNGGMSFELGLPYFSHTTEGVSMTWESGSPSIGKLYSDELIKLLGAARKKDSALEKKHYDIAASQQQQLETIVLSLLNKLYEETKVKRLCMAGGVALNCVVNGKILSETPFEEVYIQPAAHDSGTSIGAAYYVYHEVLKNPRDFTMKHAYYGPKYSDRVVAQVLTDRKIPFQEHDPHVVPGMVADEIAQGKIVGLFQGRMEFGPRALGNRSIVVDPRRAEMKDILNQRIKHRETFRPFAPSILEEKTGEYFQHSHASPYMLFTYKVKSGKEKEIPAPTHVDGSGRVQTVSKEANPFYWSVIKAFEEKTNVPVVLNTSFNDNEPIVCTPEEAIDCFTRTKMDTLVLGNLVVQ